MTVAAPVPDKNDLPCAKPMRPVPIRQYAIITLRMAENGPVIFVEQPR